MAEQEKKETQRYFVFVCPECRRQEAGRGSRCPFCAEPAGNGMQDWPEAVRIEVVPASRVTQLEDQLREWAIGQRDGEFELWRLACDNDDKEGILLHGTARRCFEQVIAYLATQPKEEEVQGG